MSAEKQVVLTRPRQRNDKVTPHTHAWAEGLRQSFEENGWQVTDCSLEKAGRVPVEEALMASPGSVFVFYGHGDEDALLAQEHGDTPVCDLTNAEQLAGRKVYVMACHSAKEQGLGHVAVEEHGALVYFGYTDLVKGYWDSCKGHGGMMYALGECVNSGMRAWIARPELSARKIEQKMKNVYANWIDYYIEADDMDSTVTTEFAKRLLHNMDALELLGDENMCLTCPVS